MDDRPAFHFAPARHWLNDPNGLVWHDGLHHLFFQHNPRADVWGHVSWGHAVSPDLRTWQELPVALEASEAEYVYSGSVVVDHENTSGLGAAGRPAMVALYTSHDPRDRHEAQSLAWSLDGGRTWRRHPDNPVLDLGTPDFRDPKVLRHQGRWLMAVARSEEHRVQLYASDDLRHWEHLSDLGPFGGVEGPWECPDLFPLRVEGTDEVRWVVVVSVLGGGPAGGSGTQYLVGDFDGTTFTPDPRWDLTRPAWVDHGSDYYAATSFTDEPQGRRVLLAWMSNWTYAADIPAAGYRGLMTAPRTYALRPGQAAVPLLVQRPLPELAPDVAHRTGPLALTPGVRLLPDPWRGRSLVVRAELDPGAAERCGLQVRVGEEERTVVGFDASRREVYVDRTASGAAGFHPSFAARHAAPLEPVGGVVRLEVHVDLTSVEVYADDGAVTLTDLVFPARASDGLAVFAEGGPATLRSLELAPVTPAG